MVVSDLFVSWWVCRRTPTVGSRSQPLLSPGRGGSHAVGVAPYVGLCPFDDRRRLAVSRVDVVGETDKGLGRLVGSQVKNGVRTYVAPGNQQDLGDGAER